MWRIIKLAIARALAELLIRFGVWFGKTFGPFLALVLAVCGIVWFAMYKLPAWVDVVGLVSAWTVQIGVLAMGLAMFVSTVLGRSETVPLFTEEVAAFERREGPSTADLATNPNAWQEWLNKGVRIGRWQSRDGTGRAAGIAWLKTIDCHILVAGETGQGKSGTEWQILDEIEPAIDGGAAEAIVFDPKIGTEMWACQYMRTQSGKPLVKEENFHWGQGEGETISSITGKPMLYEETFLEPLEALVAEMRTRALEVREIGQYHIATPDSPHRFIFVDEGAQLVRPHVPPVIANRIIGAVDTLAHQGRALGYTVIVCTQYPTVEAIKFRSGLTVGLCLPIKSDQGVDMVLGEGARRKGAAADLLPRNLPGIAYMSYRGARLLRVARNGPDWSQIDVKPPDGGGKKPTPKRLSWKTTEDMGTDAKIYEMDHYREEPAA